jgi:hypothetical protein
VSAVGHYLEEEGIATAGISLVREHSEAMRPPRALWVPFMLGRPLGAPNAPAFQRDVLRAVLGLLERPRGPVLEDYPHEAPVSDAVVDIPEGESCAVNFGRPPAAAGEHPLVRRLAEEIAQLRPWRDLGARRRGGSTFGVSGRTPEDAAAFVVAFLGETAPASDRPGQPLGQALKFAVDDLRAFYEEAAAAQPGEFTSDALMRWFYLETVAGEALLAVQRAARSSGDESVRAIAERALVPRAILNRAGG